MPQFSLYDDDKPSTPAPRRQGGGGFSLYGDKKEEEQEDTTSSSLLSKITTPLSWTLDKVTRPGAATAGAVGDALQGKNPLPRAMANLTGERKDSFSDVLEEQGMDEGKLRDVTGFALDVVVDPLNLVGGLPAKALAATTKIRPIAKGLKAVKESGVVKELGEKFVPYYGLGKFKEAAPAAGREAMSYADKRRLLASSLEATREDAATEAMDLFKGINPDEAWEIANALDKGTPLAHPRLEALRQQTKARFDEQWAKEAAAGIMPPERKVDNYVTYLLKRGGKEDRVRALSGKNRFALEREMKTLEQAREAGAEPDIRRIFAHRIGGGERALKVNNFFLDAAQQFGQKAKTAPQAGWRTVKLAGEDPMKASVKGVYFPPEIAADLEKMVELSSDPSSLGKIFNAATSLWKGYATRINPGFHFRNHVSNMANSWIGGMKAEQMVQRYAEAAKWDSAPKAIGRHSPEAINRAMHEYGVVGGHHTAFQELDSLVDEQLKEATMGKAGKVLNAINPLSKSNAALKVGGHVGNTVETWSRKALFLDQLHKGKSLEDAALHVKKYLFDYSELTDFEKKVRNVVPFYTWMRKNLPLQIEAVMTQPHKVAAQGKLFNSIERATAEEGQLVPHEERPDYMQEVGYLQLPTQTDTGADVFANPSLPIQDLNRLGGENLLASVNPLIRVPIELAMNQEAFTERPIYSPQTGPMGLKKANPLSEGLRQFSDALGIDVASIVGAVNTNRGVEQPAIIDYAMRQVPVTTTLGRTVSTGGVEEAGGIDALGGMPSNVANILGLSNKTITDEQRRNTLRAKKRDAKAAATAKRREQRRIKKSESSSLYSEWLGGGD